MTTLTQTRPTSTARARLSVAPLARTLPRPPHLVAPEQARLGDFIGIFGGINFRPDLGREPEMYTEVAFKRGVLGTENYFLDELSDADAARFTEITAVPYVGMDHHRIVRQASMVQEAQPYQIHLVQFTDAILYVHPRWLQGIWGQEPDQDSHRPLIMMLEGARSMRDAARCLEKTQCYMKVFCAALPAKVRSTLNLGLDLPPVEDFFASGDADHAFVR